MSLISEPQSRAEGILLGEEVVPQSRVEKLLSKLGGSEIEADEPQSRIESLLLSAIANAGPAIDIQELSVTENGTYTAEEGAAYSPVVVDVSGGEGGGTNTQVLFDSGKSTVTGTDVLLSSITVAKTGIYTVEWIMSRGANSTNVETYIYINNHKYGGDWSFDNSPVEFNRLALPSVSGVSLNAGDVVEIRGRTVSGTVYAASLIIQEETA